VKIRAKMVLAVLPLVVTPLLLGGLASALAARNGITAIARDFLQLKADELEKYASSQWEILSENGLDDKPEYVEYAKQAVRSFAAALLRSDTELIAAFDRSGELAMSSSETSLLPDELSVVKRLAAETRRGWQQIRLGGVERVAHSFSFEPWGWYVLVTETRGTFYRAVTDIYVQAAIILGVSLAVSIAMLLVLASYLTRPIRAMAGVIRGIMTDDDLSRRVEPMYRDEIGELASTFNAMTSELEKAYDQIKGFAFQAVVARKREAKIRTIFQRYVPSDVIDQYFRNPESMLVGTNRDLTVLFTDIRDFTTLSEMLPPEKIVESLNAYFEIMVDIIVEHRGIVDKYIGDAIMAFYGAPVSHPDDVVEAVHSGLDMLDALGRFNESQDAAGRTTFRMGVGINYGPVTVGNIGSERKMNYTVIGDMVNVASRMEGLCKVYGVPLIVSETVQERVREFFPCRLLDLVMAKGMQRPVRVYAVRRELGESERAAWKAHAEGLDLYYGREFEEAADRFRQVLSLLPRDPVGELHLERCLELKEHPPPADWQGVSVVTTK
jgi:adenylate cyclase